MTTSSSDIHIHYPSTIERKKTFDKLSTKTKDELKAQATPFLNLMKKYNLVAKIDGMLKEPKEVSNMRSKKSVLKGDYLNLLSVLSYPKNYEILLNDIPKNLEKLLKLMVWNYYVGAKEVNRIMKSECMEEYHIFFYYDDDRLPLPAPLNGFCDTMKTWMNYTPIDYLIPLNENVRKGILHHFSKSLKKKSSLDRLPEKEGLIIYSSETGVLNNMELLENLYENNILPFNLGKLTVTVVKQAIKYFQIPEFFTTKGLQTVASSFVLNLYSSYRTFNENESGATKEQAYKDFYNSTFQFNNNILTWVMPFINRLNASIKNDRSAYRSGQLIMDDIVKFLLENDNGKWLSFDELKYELHLKEESAKYSPNILSAETFLERRIDNKLTGKRILPDNCYTDFTEPFIGSILFMMAALGVAEIAYKEPSEKDSSYYSGLQYLRPTKLLAYVTGKTQVYTPPVVSPSEKSFNINPKHLLIQKLTDNSPFETELKKRTIQVSPSLFEINFVSLFKYCKSKADVSSFIQLFKYHITDELPPIWNDFFDEALRRSSVLQEKQETYFSLRIKLKDKALYQLLTENPIIRPFVIRAENDLLLIRCEGQDFVSDELEKYGFHFSLPSYNHSF